MRQNKRTMLGIVFVVAILMAVLLVSGARLKQKLSDGEARISELTKQTEQEQKRTQEIEDLQEEMQSDAYKEQIAKDRLGIVHDGEIVFKEAE